MRKLKLEELNRPDVVTYQQLTKRPITLVADNIRSMHNVGSLFRTADAFGLECLLLCGITAQPPHRDIYKTALGAELTVPWRHEPDVAAAVAALKAAGYHILLLEQTDASVPLPQYVAPAGPLALVVGNEVEGVSDSLLPLAHAALEIPQQGTKHSLNVSVAAGIALYQLCTR